jgi:hypothetical protein
VFPVRIGLRDPRSQKRDLGHPSISLFDIAVGTSCPGQGRMRFVEPIERNRKFEAMEHPSRGRANVQNWCRMRKSGSGISV